MRRESGRQAALHANARGESSSEEAAADQGSVIGSTSGALRDEVR
jgi:hypothetical protein